MPLMSETITLTYDLLRRREDQTHAEPPVATIRVTVKPEYTKPEPKP